MVLKPPDFPFPRLAGEPIRGGDGIVGTKYADRINAFGGDDVLLGYAGSDKVGSRAPKIG
jgi:hypothetical protein